MYVGDRVKLKGPPVRHGEVTAMIGCKPSEVKYE